MLGMIETFAVLPDLVVIPRSHFITVDSAFRPGALLRSVVDLEPMSTRKRAATQDQGTRCGDEMASDNKNPLQVSLQGFGYKAWRCPTFA